MTQPANGITPDASGVLKTRRRGPPVSDVGVVGAAVAACAAVGMIGLLAKRSRRDRREAHEDAVGACAERLKDGAMALSASVLLDSAFEHFRGVYQNRAMYAAPVAAAASMSAALARRAPRQLRTAIFITAGATGTAGVAFHIYNIAKRPGGFSLDNFFYAAPVLAPGALALSGFLGYAASHLEHAWERIGAGRTRREIGPALGVMMSVGILSTVAEAALLHFRGAFHDPFMYAPVTIPPAAALALATASLKPTRATIAFARGALRATAATGVAGSAFHVYGVQRNMGGWANWTQNLFAGPPIPAPPSFTGLAIGGLGILHLLEKEIEHPESA